MFIDAHYVPRPALGKAIGEFWSSVLDAPAAVFGMYYQIGQGLWTDRNKEKETIYWLGVLMYPVLAFGVISIFFFPAVAAVILGIFIGLPLIAVTVINLSNQEIDESVN